MELHGLHALLRDIHGLYLYGSLPQYYAARFADAFNRFDAGMVANQATLQVHATLRTKFRDSVTSCFPGCTRNLLESYAVVSLESSTTGVRPDGDVPLRGRRAHSHFRGTGLEVVVHYLQSDHGRSISGSTEAAVDCPCCGPGLSAGRGMPRTVQ